MVRELPASSEEDRRGEPEKNPRRKKRRTRAAEGDGDIFGDMGEQLPLLVQFLATSNLHLLSSPPPSLTIFIQETGVLIVLTQRHTGI